MSHTLILLFHPDFARSRANKALLAAAGALEHVEVVDMYAHYPDGVVDVDTEVQRLLAADRLVIQFPVQWYSTPALLKTWQDAVLTRMFYIQYAQEGSKLEGTPLLVTATAGNVPEAYAPAGVNLFPLEDLLRPLQATANRCGLPWSAPCLVYAANKLGDAELRAAGDRYAEQLRQWRGETAAADRGAVLQDG